MSAQFILRYAGAGVTFRSGTLELVSDDKADRYVSESDAWLAAHQHNLNADHCAVVNWYLLQQQAARTN